MIITDQTCRLVSGAAAAVAQLVLLGAVVIALLWKRYQEHPQRPWNVWVLDVSKQGFSSLAAHVCGILIAIVAARTSTVSSECAWYLIAFTLDTTLGTVFAVMIHNGLLSFARNVHQRYKANSGRYFEWVMVTLDSIKDSGSYGNPISYTKWALQLAEWVVATMVGRLLVGIIMVIAAPILQGLTISLDDAFEGHPKLLLFFVMVIVPMTLNVIQAIVQDQALKWKKRQPTPAPISSEGHGLLNNDGSHLVNTV